MSTAATSRPSNAASSAANAGDPTPSARSINSAVQDALEKANRNAGRVVWTAALQRTRLTDPAHRLVVESSRDVEPDDFVELSPFDIWEARFPIPLNYVYPAGHGPTVFALADGLVKLLDKYPSLGGRFRVEGDNRDRVFVRYDKTKAGRNDRPRVKIFEGRTAEEDEFDGWARGLFDTKMVASVSCGLPIRTGTALFEARVTPVEGGRTVVSVCASHGLVDMQSLAQIVADWGRLCRGAPVTMKYECQRQRLSVDPGEEDSDDEEEEEVQEDESKKTDSAAKVQKSVEELGWQDKPFVPRLANMARDEMLSNADVRAFKFTVDDVTKLKEVVRAGRAWPVFEEKGYRLSAHDVLTAIVWQSLARVHPYHPEEEWQLSVVVNWRSVSDRISKDYFGNATTTPHTSRTMKQVVHEMDLSECALVVRELGMICPAELENLISHQNKLQKNEKGLGNFINIDAPLIENGKGLYISNFSKFDIFDADFGTGRPEMARFPQPSIPGTCYAYPDPEAGSRDVTFIVSLSGEDSERLYGLDCAAGRAVISKPPPTLDEPYCQKDTIGKLQDAGSKTMATAQRSVPVVGKLQDVGTKAIATAERNVQGAKEEIKDFTRRLKTLLIGNRDSEKGEEDVSSDEEE